MSGFNATSHGSQDFYPTFLSSQLGFDPTDVTVVTVVGQLGALIGGMTIGYISTFAGRRLTMMTAAVLGGALVPAYILPRNMSLVASAFFTQFFVGGIWGMLLLFLSSLFSLNMPGYTKLTQPHRTHPNPPPRTLPTRTPLPPRRLHLPTRQPSLLRLRHNPSHNRPTLPPTPIPNRTQPFRLRKSDWDIHGRRLGL